MYAIRASSTATRRGDALATVDSFEAAREFFATKFRAGITIVAFEIDAENDAADVYMSHGGLYVVEASA